jgi:hypothetical protein
VSCRERFRLSYSAALCDGAEETRRSFSS